MKADSKSSVLLEELMGAINCCTRNLLFLCKLSEKRGAKAGDETLAAASALNTVKAKSCTLYVFVFIIS